MRRFSHISVLAVAALAALAACSKADLSADAVSNKEKSVGVQFTPAKYVTKADDDSKRAEFTGSSFGAYAWATAREGYFMENLDIIKKVILHDNVAWGPRDTTIYWPSKGTVDFICYYPRVVDEGYVYIDPSTIRYVNFDVTSKKTGTPGSYDGQVDLMYSTKAVGYSYVPDQAEEMGYTSVPAIFSHALAKVGIKAAQTYSLKTERGADGKIYTTRWEVRVTSAQFVGAATNGSATFTLNRQQQVSKGLVNWDKPARVKLVGERPTEFKVWTTGAKKFDQNLQLPEDGLLLDILTRNDMGYVTGGFKDIMPDIYMIPQMLESGVQQLELGITIKTFRSCEGGTEEPMGTERINRTVDLRIADSVEAWQINQHTIYYIMVSPAYGDGNGGNGTGDPLRPDYPVNPTDPDMGGGYVTFDPTMEDYLPAVIGI
ncbi:MAG: fimbrillin family protein [Bacteroidia bacterium]|nr:fimbrillin family protein [Bacteroidia bacterium]